MLEQICDPDFEAGHIRARTALMIVSGVTPAKGAPNCGEMEKNERFQKSS
jgi:hypothetical protein